MFNPWDPGSARALAALGFPALATTSSGFAASLGRLDGAVSREGLAAYGRDVALGLRRRLLSCPRDTGGFRPRRPPPAGLRQRVEDPRSAGIIE